MSTVLVIDDNRGVQAALEILFSLHDVRTLSASSPDEGLALLDTEQVDLVLQDMNFSADTTSGEEGIELFHRIRAVDPDLPVILLTAWTHLETAVELVRAGAADYMAKPWDDTKLTTTARNLIRMRELARANRRLSAARSRAREALADRYDLRGIVYDSDAMHQVVSLATQVAHADVPVLITGPNGAGKEKVAEIVRANSSVKDGPFVKVNVGALPAELMESELFGAEAGAYTGAQKARAGRFEAADGGTLFLDEIGNLPLAGQVKLLRILQTGEFERLGSASTRRVRVRVISATNTDLRAAIEAGTFREDLYYRLNVIELRVPPLAERPEDILPLAQAFLGDGKRLADDAKAVLRTHAWPGNVRELENAMRRAALLATGDAVHAAALGLPTTTPSARTAPSADPRPDEIERALARAHGVVAHAAEELGLSRQALYRRMEKFGLHG